MPLWFSDNVTSIICKATAIFLSFNIFMNFISKRKKEKYIITAFRNFSNMLLDNRTACKFELVRKTGQYFLWQMI